MKNITCVKIPPQGPCSLETFEDTLRNYQERVDGYIEQVRIKGPEQFSIRYLIVNEDGHSKELPINYTASYRLYPDVILGTALLFRGKARAEELESATEEDLAWCERARLNTRESQQRGW